MVLEYLSAGTRLVWVVEPRTRSVTAYRSRTEVRVAPSRSGDRGRHYALTARPFPRGLPTPDTLQYNKSG